MLNRGTRKKIKPKPLRRLSIGHSHLSIFEEAICCSYIHELNRDDIYILCSHVLYKTIGLDQDTSWAG